MLGPPNEDCAADEIFAYREQFLENDESLYYAGWYSIAGDEQGLERTISVGASNVARLMLPTFPISTN